MEQRIGSSSQPLEGAGFDPAFIPGLTSPASGREEDAKTKTKTDGPEDDATAPEADAGTEAAEETTEETAEAAEEPAASADGSETPEEDPDPAPEGPVFEASDRRARIVADHSGVRLRLDDQECEFRWDEIGAVETETPRFGKRYTVTVHTPDRRWYFLEIEADSRSRFAEWDAELDAVLDEYFDDEAGDEDKTADAADDSDTAADDSEDSKDSKEAKDPEESEGSEEAEEAEEAKKSSA
ncbi:MULTISPECIES: hypothetical protein [unclassified Streptomyces]|uniref:hypothetical protein n=1 Tax=unclassified Streptomyces TaxID=2593676 RepID=UPI000F6D43D9|nr:MULTISPECIES: hypothetical protein [unclassified Streptomyces]AZM60303.1 hypothetical protein DLM49_12710 [Streptomyces sp. WAC 01438]RSM98042.1 hypothetical protein DMA10_10050 [Streptomyces sp. WAC 01420]